MTASTARRSHRTRRTIPADLPLLKPERVHDLLVGYQHPYLLRIDEPEQNRTLLQVFTVAEVDKLIAALQVTKERMIEEQIKVQTYLDTHDLITGEAR